MFSKELRKYISNPVVGLLPFVVFIILHTVGIKDLYALSISMALAIIGEVSIRSFYKSGGFSTAFYVSGIAMFLTLIFWFFSHQYLERANTYVVACEIFIILLFMLLRISKTYINARFFRKKNLLQKALLNEYYISISIIQYALTFHVFCILLYRQFTLDPAYVAFVDFMIFSVSPIFIIFLAGAYQVYKVSTLAAKLKKEEWIPIVTEKGEVTGKIAKSVSQNMKNRFLHPVVRVALVSNSKVYLQKRSNNEILNPAKLDYPFEKYLLFNHEINLAARNSIRQMIREDLNISIKFVLKYVFENDDTKRLNFLFVANVENEDDIKRSDMMTGKFWTVKQIEDSFADEIFGECFELEFEYLKNMILIPSETNILEKVN